MNKLKLSPFIIFIICCISLTCLPRISISAPCENLPDENCCVGDDCSGCDWMVTQSCELNKTYTAPGNVIVAPGVILTLKNNASLNIDFNHKNLTVQKGGGVLVKDGTKVDNYFLTDSTTPVLGVFPGVYADPELFRDGSTYYLTGSNIDWQTISIYESTDLVNFTLKTTYDPSSFPLHAYKYRGIWCGSLSKYKGKYYLFWNSQRSDGDYGSVFYAVADDDNLVFGEPHAINEDKTNMPRTYVNLGCTPDAVNGCLHDMRNAGHIFQDGDDTWYVYNSGGIISYLMDDTFEMVSGKQVVVNVPDVVYEVEEEPAFFKRNGKYYLMWSFSNDNRGYSIPYIMADSMADLNVGQNTSFSYIIYSLSQQCSSEWLYKEIGGSGNVIDDGSGTAAFGHLDNRIIIIAEVGDIGNISIHLVDDPAVVAGEEVVLFDKTSRNMTVNIDNGNSTEQMIADALTEHDIIASVITNCKNCVWTLGKGTDNVSLTGGVNHQYYAVYHKAVFVRGKEQYPRRVYLSKLHFYDDGRIKSLNAVNIHWKWNSPGDEPANAEYALYVKPIKNSWVGYDSPCIDSAEINDQWTTCPWDEENCPSGSCYKYVGYCPSSEAPAYDKSTIEKIRVCYSTDNWATQTCEETTFDGIEDNVIIEF